MDELTSEMPELAEYLSTSTDRSSAKGFELSLVTVGELGDLVDAGKSNWDIVTVLGEFLFGARIKREESGSDFQSESASIFSRSFPDWKPAMSY